MPALETPDVASARWSAEARVLIAPARAYRELLQSLDLGRASALLLRRPLLLLLFLGATISALASGRFSVRLIVDGALSFAFVPAIEMAALAIVAGRRARARALPFANASDLFFAGN